MNRRAGLDSQAERKIRVPVKNQTLIMQSILIEMLKIILWSSVIIFYWIHFCDVCLL
jgi:hypothetical protein